MANPGKISQARAELIARAHPCEQCREYTYKKLAVRPADPVHRRELNEAWHVVRVCGVCGLQQELGIDPHGEIVYSG